MNNRLDQFSGSVELMRMMEEAGVINDPAFTSQWQWCTSPLRNGQVAARFQQRLANMLAPRIIAKQIAGGSVGAWPSVDPANAILVGYEAGSNREVPIAVDVLNRHVLVSGSSGSGKTTWLSLVLFQVVSRKLATVVFQDHKGEGRKILNIRAEGVGIFRPDQEPWNMIEPVGHRETYWLSLMSEIGKAFNLRPETWTELVEILNRIERGMKPGEPYPSLRDFERLLFHLAEKEHRPKLQTAASGFTSLNSVLGRTACIRKAPVLDGRYEVRVHEHLGLPPRIHSLIAAVRLLRTQMAAGAEGKTTPGLRQLYVSDEATLEFGKELSQGAGSGYISPHKRAITQIRSAGIGILAGVQTVSEIDESLKSNVATVMCLRCPNPKEAREATQMLGLPADAATEIQNLPVGVGYIRSEGFRSPVKIAVPHFDLGKYPGDSEVAQKLAPEMAWLQEHTVFSPNRTNDAQPLRYSEILGEQAESAAPVEVDATTEGPSAQEIRQHFFAEHRALLRDIEMNPDTSITEHYRHLGWSAGRGNRVKEQLVEMGLIGVERERSLNGRPREILVLTEMGERLLHEDAD